MQHTFGIIFSSFLPSISPHLTSSFAAVAAAEEGREGERATHFCASGINALAAAAAMGNIYLSKKASVRLGIRVQRGR